jgi:hypothetical protein
MRTIGHTLPPDIRPEVLLTDIRGKIGMKSIKVGTSMGWIPVLMPVYFGRSKKTYYSLLAKDTFFAQ